MGDLSSVFEFAATLIGLFLSTMLSHWYTTILIFLFILAGIVTVLLSVRGTK